MGYGLWIKGYGLWVMGYGLWVMGYGLKVMAYGLEVMFCVAYARNLGGNLHVKSKDLNGPEIYI